MKKVYIYFVRKFIEWAFNFGPGGKYWEEVQKFVAMLADKTIPGAEKKAKVIEMMKNIGYAGSAFLLDTAIQIAYMLLLDAQGKLEEKIK